MSALPADLAAEAQSLRREYELRNRAMMNERFFSHATHGSLSSILRNTVRGLGSQYAINSLNGGNRDSWRNSFARAGAGGYPQSLLTAANERFKGRQLLDNEGLSCLLILLFIDDAKINTTRLHRILRNLCYHTPTREWVVNSLLSILDKSNESKPPLELQNNLSLDMPPAAKVRKSTSSSKSAECALSATATSSKSEKTPSWLSISMDAALGFRANVFQVNRLATGKKSTNTTGADRANCISIHPGASTIVCRHSLEVLISLAKSFPGHFLPWKGLEASSEESEKSTVKDKSKLTSSTPTSTNKGESKKTGSTNSTSSSENNSGSNPEFWETLLKLDVQSTSKKGKSVARSHSNVTNIKGGEDDDTNAFNFESSPFGNLLAMLASPVIRRSSVLTDKLLRLLSLISVAEDQMKKNTESNAVAVSAAEAGARKSLISADHLRLAVEVLTSKSCSEQGLEDVNALLLNLSHGHEPTRDTILRLLLQGARELGSVVRQNVIDLQMELQTLKKQNPDDSVASGDDSEESKEKEKEALAGKKQKPSGAILDRFTNLEVVLNAPSKVKGGSELQLPTMNALTNKTSSQAFFLRVLKVIIELRESALISMKKKRLVKAAAKEAKEQKKKAEEKSEDVERGESEQMEVDKKSTAEDGNCGEDKKEAEEEDDSLASLSDELSLEELWDALSSCLRELADTPDHHAVLVLQATVEAFFLVHAAATQPDDGKKKVRTFHLNYAVGVVTSTSFGPKSTTYLLHGHFLKIKSNFQGTPDTTYKCLIYGYYERRGSDSEVNGP